MTRAYRRYLIKTTLTGETFIERDGVLIAWAKDEQDAKRIVDESLD